MLAVRYDRYRGRYVSKGQVSKGRSYTDTSFKEEYKRGNCKTLSRKIEKTSSRQSGQHSPLPCVRYKE